MKRQLCTCLALAALIGWGAPASATILYSDTFSRTTGSGDGNGDPNGPAPNFSDWGMNDNGLGGTVAQTWVAGPSRGGGGRNAVTNGSQGLSFGTSSTFEFDAAAASPAGFTVELDFARFVDIPDPVPGPNGYIAFGLGVDNGTAPTDFTAIGAGDWTVLFQQANAGNAANAEVYVDGVLVSNFDYLNPDVPHTLVLTVTPRHAGGVRRNRYGERQRADRWDHLPRFLDDRRRRLRQLHGQREQLSGTLHRQPRSLGDPRADGSVDRRPRDYDRVRASQPLLGVG